MNEEILQYLWNFKKFRNFDFTSPWHGPGENILPGDEKATK